LLKLLRRLSLVSINDGKLHPDVVKVWPEIFKDIQVRTIPLEYLEAILVTFLDGKTWEIAIDATKKGADLDEIEFGLEELLEAYETEIANVDFRLNTKKVKHDMQRRTKHFLKKGK
jgi:hypothetical protein